MEIRLAACEFLHAYSKCLARHATMASNRSIWLMGPDPYEKPQQDPEPGPEIRLDESQPRPGLN
ncbi:MAG: hypothetical protein JWM59_1218 [Verrucomicrobiales bacterium]|nr:hypothetical protein [Verrucomicrobiales bacterium]